jgi:hypothetical protein
LTVSAQFSWLEAEVLELELYAELDVLSVAWFKICRELSGFVEAGKV